MQNRIFTFISLFLIFSTTLSAQFITTWKTDNPGSSNDNQITIPINGGGYNYNVDWGDGSSDSNLSLEHTHTYAASGIYTVIITGTFPQIYFNGGGFFGDNTDFEKILTIENWGTNPWISMANAFSGCKNLTINATDAPNLFLAFDLSYMFREASSLNADLSSWNVSNVELFNGMFREATSFNGNITNWDVSGAEEMKEMFFFASSFNQDISQWHTENVNTMELMFAGATVFNQDISFKLATGAWNTGSVTNMNQMLAGTEDFDQPIGNWNTASVTNIAAIFSSAHTFNQDVSGWDISGVNDPSGLSGLFRDATSFNQDLSAWGVAIGGITNLSEMFKGATAFDQDLSGWDVSNVSNFHSMFKDNTGFNQNISTWNLGSAFDLRLMFDGASAFDQDLGGWNVSNITGNRMIKMLDNSGLSIDNYDNTLIGWAGQTVQSNVDLGAEHLSYCAGANARASLIAQGWTITDAGQGCISVYKGNDTTGSEIINAQVQPFDFGSINQGASKTFSFTIDNNTGSDLSNFIGNITTNTGTAFSLLTPPTLPTTLNTGSPITLTIELTNPAPGSFTETVTFYYDTYTASTEQFTFTITGVVTSGPEPKIAVFEGNINGTPIISSGTFLVGEANRDAPLPPTNQIIIENKGSADLNIFDITLPGSEFSYTAPTSPFIIPVNNSQTIDLFLDTSTGGSFSDLLTIGSNDYTDPDFEITLNGTIYGPEINVINGTDIFSDPPISNGLGTTIDFGSVLEGTDIIRQFTITNYGPVDLSILSIDIPAGQFSITSSIPTVIPGIVDAVPETAVISITLDGTVAGNFNEIITINSDDDLTPSFTFNIAGTIIDPNTPKIYWTDETGNQINRSNIDGSLFEQYHTSTAAPRGIAVDAVNNVLYWSTSFGDIWKGDITPSGIANTTKIIDDGTDLPKELAGIATDVSGQKVYWADQSDKTLKEADLTAPNPNLTIQTIHTFTGPNETPYGIDIDATNSKIFFTYIGDGGFGNYSAVGSINFDGSNYIVYETQGGSYDNAFFYDVKIDKVNDKIYWSGSGSSIGTSAIFKADLTVFGNITSFSSPDTPFGIALDLNGNNIYWATQGGTPQIIRANLDGSTQVIIQSGSPHLSIPNYISLGTLQTGCSNPPTISAGGSQTICAGSTASLLALQNGEPTTITWGTSGDGTFSSTTSLSTIYTPSPNDILAGSITIGIIADDPDGTGPCTGSSDEMQLTINTAATVNAGTDIINCTGLLYILNEASKGGSASTVLWSTSGSGTFGNTSDVVTYYTPSPADVAAGSVILTITTDDPDGIGPCVAVTDQLIMSFSSATVNAGADITSCGSGDISLSGGFGGAASSILWSSPSGGTFSDATLTDAIYTPSAADLTIGSVTLTITTDDPDGSGPCPAVTDQVLITFLALPTVNVGADQTICANNSATILATLTNATSGNWSSDGDGTFDNTSSLNAIYTPGITDSGSSITLTFTVPDPDGSGSCIETTDQLILTVNSLDVVDAGVDQTICETGTVSLSATINNATTPVFWVSSGDGGFDDAMSLSPIYSPGATDRTNGSVILTISSGTPSSNGVCPTASDALTVTLAPTHTADAGADQTMCPSDVITLTGAVGGGASAGTWSSDGDGLFDDNTSLTTNYTPGSGDSSTGTVILTLTTVATNCSSMSDQVQLNISLPISAIDQSATLKTNETALIDVFNGGFINTGDVISTSIISNPAKGTVEINADGTINYTALAGNVGSDSFGFEIKNQCNQTANATASITITNDAPNFEDGSATAVPGSPVTIDIISLISDLNGNLDLSSIRIIQQPGSGAKATLDANNNLIVDYTGMVFFGTDEVIIEVCDFDGACTEASIFINVEALPIKAFNAVSPNGDGKHDFLEFQYIEAYPNNEIKIFNRWGDIVFEAAGYNNNDVIFSGVSNKGGNNELPTGTYYYTVHLIDTDETVNGYFELRR